MGLRLMLVPHLQRVPALNLRTGEVRWGHLMHPTLDIGDMPHFKERLACWMREGEGRTGPLHEGGREA